ncbi:MAG: putative secreted protein [Circular genetic element sp.]|nr:MAG: putative secreted protein [Circular genetic element sp.]
MLRVSPRSFFEIGGQIIESTVGDPTPGQGVSSGVQRKIDKRMTKMARKEFYKGIDSVTPDGLPSIQALAYETKKMKTGGSMMKRGLGIAITLAAMDGPLPVGDVLAAGFLLGGGLFLAGSGAKGAIEEIRS